MEEKVDSISEKNGNIEKKNAQILQVTEKSHSKMKEGYMRLINGIRIKKIAGQTLMVPTGKAVSKVYQPAVLNSDAAVLVNMMTEDFTVNSIVAQGMNIFRVDEAILRKDVEHLINQLMLAGMLEGEEVERRLKSADRKSVV